MQSQYFIVEPCFGCPFRVEGIHFVPHQSFDDGFTLLFFHANSLHKETFTVLITQLLKIVSPVKIRDIWAIDNPNHGRSASLNHALLNSEEYRHKWSASEYANAAYAFLSTTSHGIDFKRRNLIGIAHSAGATGLMMLQNAHPEIPFRGFILMDPGSFLPGQPSTRKFTRFFNSRALSKRDTWTSIEEARQDLSRTYRRFAPATLDAFLECGLRRVDDSDAVTLSCSKEQEAAYYFSNDAILPAAEILLKLSKEDRLPIHLIVCLKDEYRGMADESKALQIMAVGKMSYGKVQFVGTGGHMFPQVEPTLTAAYLRKALTRICDPSARL